VASIIIVDRDPEFASKLGTVLTRDVGKSVTHVATTAGLDDALKAEPSVVVYGPGVPLERAIESAQAVSARPTPPAAVLVVPKITTELLRKAMRSGFRDVVSSESTFGEVAASVTEAYDDVARRRSATAESVTASDGGRGGRVVTVFSTKGGVGKTVIASNLGVALADTVGVKTILLDLDLQFGDTGIMLQLEPERTVFDAMKVYDRLDVDMLRGFLTHHKSGLDVLLAPIRPEDAEMVTAARVSRIISMLREIADVVVIDTPAAFNDVVLAAIDKSDEVLAVATMDVASLKNTRISLQKLRQLGYGNGFIKLILNRADSKVWLEPWDVAHAIEGSITARIPSDRLVPRSVNKGVPVVSDAPRSAVAKSLVGLARMVAAKEGAGGDDA